MDASSPKTDTKLASKLPSQDAADGDQESPVEGVARTSISENSLPKVSRAASLSTCSVTTWNTTEFDDSYDYDDDDCAAERRPSLFEELAKFQRQHSITGTEQDLQPSLTKLERRQSVESLDPRKEGVYRQPIARSILNDNDDAALARKLQYDQLETDELELALFLSRQEHNLSQFEDDE